MTFQRITAIALSLVGGVFFLMLCLFLPAQADENAASGHVPRWVEFPLAIGPSLFADVYKNSIIWSQYGWPDAPPSCTMTNSNAVQRPSILAPNSGHLANFSQIGITSNPVRNDSEDLFPRQPTPPDVDWDICLYDAQTGQITHITNTGAQDEWPRLHGNWLVFKRGSISNQRVIVKNLTTGQETTLPYGFWPDTPNIHNEVVVYHDWDSVQSVPSERILAYDLTTQELMTITYSPNPPFEFAHVYFPDVYSGTVVWQQSPPANQDYDIISYDLSSQSFFTISDKAGNEEHPRIDGDLVVWDWHGDIYGYDLATSQRLTITQDAWWQIWPAVSGNLVVWMDSRNGQWDIYGYDLALGETYRITSDPRYEYVPAVWENLVAYDRFGGGAAGARKMTEFAFLPLNLK